MGIQTVLIRAFAAAALLIAAAAPLPGALQAGEAPDAAAVVGKAFHHMRGRTSRSTVEMTIHRPDFQRTMVMVGWTEGTSDALIFIKSPPKDAGNGTLKKGREMWTFNPRINRVIKLPPSMMSQSWMGSDFSNNDLAKTDSLLHDYVHRITRQESREGLTVYQIESIPKENAPVVWGKQEMEIREDGILLRQAFFDQDMVKVKEMSVDEIRMLGGRRFPKRWTMRPAEEPERFTRLIYQDLAFDVPLRPGLFTLTSLKSQRY